AGPGQGGGARVGGGERDSEQGGNAVRCHVVEQQPVEDVEAPAEPGGEDHRPLVAVHVEQRAAAAHALDRLHGFLPPNIRGQFLTPCPDLAACTGQVSRAWMQLRAWRCKVAPSARITPVTW